MWSASDVHVIPCATHIRCNDQTQAEAVEDVESEPGVFVPDRIGVVYTGQIPLGGGSVYSLGTSAQEIFADMMDGTRKAKGHRVKEQADSGQRASISLSLIEILEIPRRQL